MKKILILSVLINVFILTPCLIFGAGLSDTDVHSQPGSPYSFAADHKATDPTFNTIIMRITGDVDSNAVDESATETEHRSGGYHFNDPWGPNGEYFHSWLRQGSQKVRLWKLNRSTFTVTKELDDIFPGNQFNYDRGIWFDDVSPYIIYGTNANTGNHNIERFNWDTSTHEGLAGQTFEILKSFGSLNIHQLTCSNDRDKFSFYTDTAAQRIKVWIRLTDTTYALDCSTWTAFDESQITQDGNYVIIKGNWNYNSWASSTAYSVGDYVENTGGDNVYQCTTSGTSGGSQPTWNTIMDVTTDDNTAIWTCRGVSSNSYWDAVCDDTLAVCKFYSKLLPDYMCSKWSSSGDNVVNQQGESVNYDSLAFHPASDPTDVTFPYVHPSLHWENGTGHPSARDNYSYMALAEHSPWVVYSGEILRAKLTGGSEIMRYCHHWLDYCSSSYDQKIVSADPQGRYLLYSGAFNDGSCIRRDVFLLDTESGENKTLTVGGSQTITMGGNQTLILE